MISLTTKFENSFLSYSYACLLITIATCLINSLLVFVIKQAMLSQCYIFKLFLKRQRIPRCLFSVFLLCFLFLFGWFCFLSSQLIPCTLFVGVDKQTTFHCYLLAVPASCCYFFIAINPSSKLRKPGRRSREN